MDLGGRTALLTGATGGLGRAIATALAARVARLILSSRKAEELVKLARSLPGGGHTTLVSDLGEEGAALALLEQAGDIDVLVANAALPASGRLEGFSQDEIGHALRVNLERRRAATRPRYGNIAAGRKRRGAGDRARQVGDLRGSDSSAGPRPLRDAGARDFRSTCRLRYYEGSRRDCVEPDRQAIGRPGSATCSATNSLRCVHVWPLVSGVSR